MSFPKRPTYVTLKNAGLDTQTVMRFLNPFWQTESSLYQYIGCEFDIMYLSTKQGLLVPFNGANAQMVRNVNCIYIKLEDIVELEKRIEFLTHQWAESQKTA